MKTSKFLILAVVLLMSGCAVYDPYYQPYQRPVYIQPAPIYVNPPPVYYRPRQPHCYMTRQWDGYYRTYRNVRVCR